ncbi:MAG: hypothetical protein ACXV5R_09005 [Candidatus Angelobacter sp.]
MKKLFTIACTLVLGSALSFAQAGTAQTPPAGDTGKTTTTTTTTTTTKKHHHHHGKKASKKGKKAAGAETTATPAATPTPK